MNKEGIKNYHKMMNMYETLLIAMKSDEKINEAIIETGSVIFREMQMFCVNHVGFLEEY